MALEISVIASAERLQAQRDQRTEAARARQREDAVQRAREAERQAEARRAAERTAEDIDRARIQREFRRDVADANLIEDLIARDVVDRRIDELVDGSVGDTHVPAQTCTVADLREPVVLLVGIAAQACGEV